MYKVIVSQKKESTLNHWNESFLKRIPSRFMLTAWNISILPAHLLVFSLGLNENANSFFATRCCFWICKNSGFLGNAVHKAALRSQTIRHYRRDEIKSTNRRLELRKGGVWKNESLSESFGSRWASKVKINAYYKQCWGKLLLKVMHYNIYKLAYLKSFLLISMVKLDHQRSAAKTLVNKIGLNT